MKQCTIIVSEKLQIYIYFFFSDCEIPLVWGTNGALRDEVTITANNSLDDMSMPQYGWLGNKPNATQVCMIFDFGSVGRMDGIPFE